MPLEVDHFLYGQNKNISIDPQKIPGGSHYKSDFLEPLVSIVVFCSFDNEGSISIRPGVENSLRRLHGVIYENDLDQVGQSVNLSDGMISLIEGQTISLGLYRNARKQKEGFSKEILIRLVPEIQ